MNGVQKVRRFLSTSTMQSLYDYVDSADCLHIQHYKLVTKCPRIVYGPVIVALSLKDARLEHGTTLYVEQLFHDMTEKIVEVPFDVRGIEIMSFDDATTKFLGTRTWPLEGNKIGAADGAEVGRGRVDICSCGVPSSLHCRKLHIQEAREKLQIELGPTFNM